MGVEHAVGLAGHGGVHDVGHHHDSRARLPGLAQRLEGVDALARLAHPDHQGALVQDRVPVAELAGDVDLDGQARPALEGVLGHQAGVEARAAGDHRHLGDGPQLLVAQVELVEHHRSRAVHPTAQGVDDGLGLLVDLLGHEVVEAALLGRLHVPGDPAHLGLDELAAHGRDPDRSGSQLGQLVVVEHDDVPGVLQDRGDVGGEEAHAVENPDDERRDAPGGDDELGLRQRDHPEGERPADLAHDVADGGGQVEALGEGLLDQVGEHLGVGLGAEHVPPLHQALGQLDVVLDDPVVHERHRAGAVEVRVGVALRRLAVGRPAVVTDPGALAVREGRRGAAEGGHRVGAVGDAQLLDRLGVDEGDPRRVVAAVLEALEAVEQDAERIIGTVTPMMPHMGP